WRFFPSLYVGIRVLRDILNVDLPIQVSYLGDQNEFEIRMEQALKDYDVGWICAQSYARENNIPRRIWGGWEAKSFAACYAPFETVIFMDADCFPAYNPMEFVNHPVFQRVGAAFWPDQIALEPGQWERFGCQYHDESGWE